MSACELSMATIDSDFAKGLLDVLNQVLGIITQIIDKVGILNPLLSGIFAAKTIKSFTKNFDKSAILYVVG